MLKPTGCSTARSCSVADFAGFSPQECGQRKAVRYRKPKVAARMAV